MWLALILLFVLVSGDGKLLKIWWRIGQPWCRRLIYSISLPRWRFWLFGEMLFSLRCRHAVENSNASQLDNELADQKQGFTVIRDLKRQTVCSEETFIHRNHAIYPTFYIGMKSNDGRKIILNDRILLGEHGQTFLKIKKPLHLASGHVNFLDW